MMKKQLLAMALLATSGVMATAVSAADGTITISGEVKGTTCTISGGTGASPGTGANFPVVLSSVQTSALAAAGQTAGAKPFFVYVGGNATCPDGTVVAVLYEASSPNINPGTGNLRNVAAATPATNVEVQIVDSAVNTPIDLRSGLNSTPATVTGGLATLPFTARYIATGGPAGAGLVSTSVQYSVTFP
ncbi:type 1 fimbrial protein [Pseudomonas yamanorum]|uniref:Type 1 fimbrial protein n=1 Tax=Pseudomonas yamanorum TaxID=515393 RepID=A0A7Y8EMV2_9PSED|nr:MULTISPECIES: fimbrial protein [Pseudomonas]MCS3419784.1 major type 1 subunit fimbrin (pilin) [Pseudomonas sp. BIGb0558]MCS3439576.1 major type 1 subunit fimbrin (pilin) [Pseudomonas sp. BIGb0450]NVZ84486.1 type 1 fimbrial protein [Pseudomonas yamanorum]NWE17075.1 type 1 fimbrial protein [Pseudomonas yamanorum]NWE42649.1 type 1 fimbrial protein [Pseudomonas yamanorum]